MKKYWKLILTMLVVALMAVTLAACGGGKVAGKTYVYDKIEIDYGDLDSSSKKIVEGLVEKMEEEYKDGTVEIVFDEDGEHVTVAGEKTTYTQEGDIVKVEGEELKVSGSKLIMEQELGMYEMKVKVVFKTK